MKLQRLISQVGAIIWTRDNMTLAGLIILTASLSALAIRSHHLSASEPPAYLTGSVLAYEVTVTKGGGTRGYFMVRLDRGEVVRVAAQAGVAPGMRVCVRAVKRGERINGFLVADSKCPAS